MEQGDKEDQLEGDQGVERDPLPPQLGLLALLEEIDVEKTAVSGTLSHSLFSAASGIEKAPARPVRGPPAHTDSSFTLTAVH